ncbi:tetratricopeptide repeat protein [Halofilum ochraceum]|uniref:tetratricopeptide repeat protein n=1 Tax=Halofilum ochraceum TaxID=1611323 RepID=UPI0009F41832|nr:tetratricopeptide repeat protein [Halofilum ochraceum]
MAAAALVLAGCATRSPSERSDDVFSILYEGKSTAQFATSLPVGSPAEAEARGDAAARDGELDEAIFEYVRGLRIAEKGSPGMLYKIGMIHERQSNTELAAIAYRWALRADPGHRPSTTRLGLMLLRHRQYEAAEHRLRPIVESGAPFWLAHNGMGVLCDLRGDHHQAANHYRDALRFNPDSALVMNNLGYSLYMAGDWAGAEKMLRAALEREENYDLAWRNLALVWARSGEYQEAIAALQRTSSTEAAYNDLGYVEMMDGNYPVATRLFHQAMDISPRYYEMAVENERRAQRLMTRERDLARQ